MDVIKTTELKKYYSNGSNTVKALDGVSLSVEQGQFIAIVGTSGWGSMGEDNFLRVICSKNTESFCSGG